MSTWQGVAVPDWTQIVAASAGGVSAVAGAVAAVASWRSATQSKAAANDVREALGLAIKPALEFHPFDVARAVGDAPLEQVYGIELRNESPWPAVDVEIEARVHDGRLYRTRLSRVESTNPKGVPRPEFVDLARGERPTEVQLHAAAAGEYTLTNAVAVRYWDERRLIQWEQTFTETHHFVVNDETRSCGRGTAREERRVSTSSW